MKFFSNMFTATDEIEMKQEGEICEGAGENSVIEEAKETMHSSQVKMDALTDKMESLRERMNGLRAEMQKVNSRAKEALSKMQNWEN